MQTIRKKSKNTVKTLLILIILAAAALPGGAEEGQNRAAAVPARPDASSKEPSAEPVTVSAVKLHIPKEKTKPSAVRRWLEVSEGRRYENDKALQDAVEQDVQELKNLKVFLSVESRITPDPQNSSGRIVHYEITDGNTFVPIVMPLYNSNVGGIQILYVQIWDNMFGSLIDWFSLSTLFLRKNDAGKIETGPWVFFPRVSNIKLGSLNLSAEFKQERVESQRYSGTSLVSSYRYDGTALAVGSEFRFGELRNLRYSVKPGVIFRYGYTDFLGSGGFSEIPFETYIAQSFYYDSVDVFHNSRKGCRAGVKNTLRLISRDGKWVTATDIRAEFAPYFAFGKEGRISYYPRVMILGVIGDRYEGLGKPLRGIPDATMDGNFAFYLNQTVGFGIWRWRGVWDLQIHPFFDLGLTTGGTRAFTGIQDIRRSTGADILLFIEKVPNLAFRFSWGFDMDSRVPWKEKKKKTEFIVRYSFSY